MRSGTLGIAPCANAMLKAVPVAENTASWRAKRASN